MLRVLNGLMLVAFLSSAGLQLNDPDPLPWVALYTSAALACLAWALGRGGRWLPALPGLLALGWSLVILLQLPADVPVAAALTNWQMQAGGSELLRELGGLWLVATWMGILCRPPPPQA